MILIQFLFVACSFHAIHVIHLLFIHNDDVDDGILMMECKLPNNNSSTKEVDDTDEDDNDAAIFKR